MADRTVDIITPASNNNLLTLDEAKLFLGMNPADTSQDETLNMLIETYSEMCAEICNRQPNPTFGKEEVVETWREIGNGRLFMSHWPIKAQDVVSVESGGVPYAFYAGGYRVKPGFIERTAPYVERVPYVMSPSGFYELEEASGKISNVGVGATKSGDWNGPVVVHYSGGYNLPDEAPKPLKQACVMLIMEQRIRMIQAQTAGIRQISHKEARVSFFDPNAILLRAVGAKSPTLQAVENILKQYMRFEV